MRIVQITDTHLSPSKTHFNGNWAPLASWIEEIRPDLVVHTGDLSIDGADRDDDLAYAVELLQRLPAPVLSVPGNHDIGHLPGSEQPVDAWRLERWRRIVGPDRWFHDLPGWRLVGLDSLVIGSGSEEEEAQHAWLEDTLARAEGRRIAVFAHKPLFVDEADEGETGYWGIAPQPRRRLLDLFARHEVALHASGHLHRAWQGRYGSMACLWAPASSFVVGPMARDMPGERVLGAVIHEMGEDLASEIVTLPVLVPYIIDDVIDEVYPPRTPVAGGA